MLDRKITYYSGNKDIKASYCTLRDALNRIAVNPNKDKIEAIRKEKDKNKRNKLKGQLRAFSFSGEFKRRGNEFLLSHSGIVCLDFDGVPPDEYKERLKTDENVFCVFTSPSGNGVKVLIKVPRDIDNDEKHKDYFRALKEDYPEIDKTGDVSRLCYESYDPDIYYNENAKTYRKTKKIEYHKIEMVNPETDISEIYTKLKRWLENKGEFFTEGNRNHYIHKLACACNRFGIYKDDAYGMMFNDFIVGGSDFSETEFKTTISSAYRNKMQFSTAKFEKEEIVTISSSRNISEEIIEEESEFKDIILLQDIEKDMLNEFDNGIQKGETTYYPKIDEIFRFMRGEVTTLHGIANHGKSAMLNQLLINKAHFDNYRFAMFSPESYPPTDFYNSIIQTYKGQSVMGKSRNKMTKTDYNDGMEFAKNHFFYVYPEESDPTPEYLVERFRTMIHKHKVDGIVIDPYNQMYHDFHGREDQYLSKTLSMFKKFAVEENIFFLIIAHPNGRLEMNQDGDIKAPWMNQISGGPMWGNKCDNILCYHRPFYKTDPLNPTCEFISQKIKKQQRNGRPGKVMLTYNWKTNRFSEDGRCPLPESGNKNFNERLEMEKQSHIFEAEALTEEESPF